MKVDYDEWIQTRLSFIRNISVRNGKYINLLILLVFYTFIVIKRILDKNVKEIWVGKEKILRKFFGMDNLKEDDVDKISLSDDCDSETYNNQHCIRTMHGDHNPLPLFGTVIKEKNMQ